MAYNPIGQGLAGLGQGIGAGLRERRMDSKLQGLMERVQGDDPAAMAELAAFNPNAARTLMSQQQSAFEQQQIQQKNQVQKVGVIADTALNIQDPVQRRAYLIQRMNQEDDPAIKEEIADSLNMDDDQLVYDLQEAVTQVKGFGKDDPAAPASVREWQFLQGLSPEQQRQWYLNKRAGTFYDQNDVQMTVDPVTGRASPVQEEGAEPRTQAEINAELADQDAKAEGKKDAERQSIRLSEEAFNRLQTVKASIANMDEAIAAIDEGASTGRITSMLPSVRESAIKLDNIQKRMGLDVISNTTFGALSESELNFALDAALPKNLPPQQLRDWLVRKKDSQEKLAAYLEKAASFLGRPGNTMADFLEQQKSQGTIDINDLVNKYAD